MNKLLLIPLNDTVVFPTMDVTLPVDTHGEERVLHALRLRTGRLSGRENEHQDGGGRQREEPHCCAEPQPVGGHADQRREDDPYGRQPRHRRLRSAHLPRPEPQRHRQSVTQRSAIDEPKPTPASATTAGHGAATITSTVTSSPIDAAFNRERTETDRRVAPSTV